MAEVQLRGNRLVIICRGVDRPTNVTIDPTHPEQIDAAVRMAISSAAGYFYGINPEYSREVERINASAAAAAIRRQLARSQPSAAPTQTAPPTPTAPPTTPRQAPPAQPPREERRREPQAQPRQEQRQEPPAQPRETPAARETGSGRRGGRTSQSTPRPTITLEWIEQQLRDSRRDDRRAQAAASLLHSNRIFVERFLDPGLQRGVERTDAQKGVTISLFNQLYQIPSFRLFLSSIAAQQQALPQRDRVFSEFVTLQAFLTEPGRNEQLGAQTEARIISAADMYIRYFLFNFIAANSGYSRYHDEISQARGDAASLPVAAWRLRNVEGARTFQPAGGVRAPSELDRAALMRLYISSPMDADTLTSASLFLRRWFLEHPERGNGRSQSRIAQWTAPEVIQPADATAQPSAQPRAQAPAQPVPQAQPSATTTVVPRVGAIGDSITAGGRYGRTLQAALRTQSSGAVVDSYGVVSESITGVRSRFRRDILDHSPAYNTVIIQGGINGIEGISVNEAESAFTRMITDARARNMKVVLLTITPWAGYQRSSTEAQRRTAELNTWLRSQAQADGSVVVVDTSALGEGNPPRLRAAYDSGDHLHPNDAGRDLIAQQIAQAAFGRAPSVTETRSALQVFADQNWLNLPERLYTHAQRGSPAELITLTRNLPAGVISMERGLQTLNRDDVPRALDRVFNDYLHRDADFLNFCRTFRENNTTPYSGVALESVTMSPRLDASERRLIMRAIQAYVNYCAGRTDEWYVRMRGDLQTLYRDVLGTGREDLHVNGFEDVRTLAAVAVMSWRRAHRSETAGAWAAPLNITPRETTPAPVPPTQVTPPEQNNQRRRVIQAG